MPSGGGTPHPTGYVHPFPKGEWDAGRIDQGQDFAPKKNGARILSPGNAQVVQAGHNAGWPGGGGFILLRLLDGDHADKYVYIAESLSATVSRGVHATPGMKVGEGHTGGTGIEIGWADRSGATLSALHGTRDQHPNHANTPEGQDMAGWLASLPQQSGAIVPSPGDVAGAVAGAAGDAAKAVASVPQQIVSAFFDALGKDGARILLYIGFVIGGMALAIGGVSVIGGGSPTAALKLATKVRP
jgi:hypothetical protein